MTWNRTVWSAGPAALATAIDTVVVSRPATIGRMRDKANLPQVDPDVLEYAAGELFIRLIADDENDLFPGGNFAHHFAINPRNDLKFPRPIIRIMRPAEPGGLMFFPLSRHRITLRRWGGQRYFFTQRHKISWRIVSADAKEKPSRN